MLNYSVAELRVISSSCFLIVFKLAYTSIKTTLISINTSHHYTTAKTFLQSYSPTPNVCEKTLARHLQT